MEAIGIKFVIAVINILGVPLYIAYCLVFKGMSLHEVIADEQVQTSLDVLAVSFYAYFTYLKVFCNNIDVHSIFENIFFYIGGFLTLTWGCYRALAQYEDYKNKKQLNKFQKDVFDEATKK